MAPITAISRKGAIPQVRNAALDAPRGVGATHLAFIDDDETADPDWLAALWACASEYGADAVHGLALSVYPKGAPAWRRCNEHKTRKTQTGDALGFVGTNNALLRLDLVGDLRFDERFRFVGGEDIVFFDALQKRGAKIAFCREAVTHEAVPWERITISATLKKAYCSGFGRVHEARLMGRPLQVTPWKLTKRFLLGSARVLVSPLLFPPLDPACAPLRAAHGTCPFAQAP